MTRSTAKPGGTTTKAMATSITDENALLLYVSLVDGFHNGRLAADIVFLVPLTKEDAMERRLLLIRSMTEGILCVALLLYKILYPTLLI